MKSWFWQGIVAVFVLYFIAMYVRPLLSPTDENAEDIAKSWNDSFERLGILPIFPPEEDFYVGDVWAVIENAEKPYERLKGKAVRVAHLDLRDEMKNANNRQPVFADTANPGASEGDRRQDRAEVVEALTDGRIHLTLTAFPGLTISRSARASGSLGGVIGGLGSGREDQELEEIRIPVAETYGVPYSSAFIRLDDWCADTKTMIYCTDAFLRRILSYSVSDQVLITRKGKYVVRLQLRLVTRVFLMRQVDQRRVTSAANGILVQSASNASKSARPPAVQQQGDTKTSNRPLEERGGSAIEGLAQSANAVSSGGLPSAGISEFRAGGTEIEIQRTFQRPVAFGYRAVTISIAASVPSLGGFK
jgi:hypothetical protein